MRDYSPSLSDPLSESWRWKDIPELEGKGIRHVVETDDRTIWVSSNEGVLEYDGYYWKTHNKNNGFVSSPVEKILSASDGQIYATCTKGIYKYDGNKWSVFFKIPDTYPFIFHNIEELSDKSIVACTNWGVIQIQKNGDINFFSTSGKINQLQKSNFDNINWINLPSEILSDNGDFDYFSDVLEIDGVEVWFAVTTQAETGKLLKFKWGEIKNNQIEKFNVFESSDDFLLGEDQKLLRNEIDGKIWVINSTSNRGLHIYDGSKWETVHFNKLFGGDEYLADIVQSKNGTIWISSMAKIFSFKNDTWKRYKAPLFPVPANRIILQNSFRDHIWVSGYKSKVLLLDFSSEQWQTYQNLSFQCKTPNGDKWFLEKNNRIVRFSKEEKVSFGIEDGLMDSPIRIVHTTKGQIWVAGSHEGKASTAVYRNNRWERHMHPKLSWGIDYRAVFEAADGTLWFGGAVDAEDDKGFLSGVLELKNPTSENLDFYHHKHGENGLNQANCYGIGQSKDGRIWIGGSKLQFYDGESWNLLPDDRMNQYVNYVTSKDGLLLVGSRYYGLFVYDGISWTNYNTSSGLSDNTIISINIIGPNNYLVASEKSICKFDGETWAIDIFPESLNLDFEGGTIFNTDEGFWINHVPRTWKRRAYQSNSESNELASFFTTRYTPTKIPPETSFEHYLETVAPDGNCYITWTGRDYFLQSDASNLMYSYRFNGGEWSPFTNENQKTFTSLPSRTHVMEIRSRDIDFNIDPTPAKITFEVDAPILKQPWFIALLLAFLSTILFFGYNIFSKNQALESLNNSLHKVNEKLKYKSKKIKKQNKEILNQQKIILKQKTSLEEYNKNLEIQNKEIQTQADTLEKMVEQVEELSKAKLSFFTNISHELRTPLSLVLGPIYQLQKSGKDLSNQEQKNLYNIIEKNASRLLKLINQLLEIRRIENSSLELKLKHTNVVSYLNNIINLFQNLAKKRNINLQFHSEPTDFTTYLDTDKIEKIIVNLLGNAFKYTGDNGNISLTFNTVIPEAYNLPNDYKSYMLLQVSDTGKGISEKELLHIFDRYYKNEKEVNNMSSGIGLSYISDLVKTYHGEIKVDTEVGKGTTFNIFIPVIPVKDSTLHISEDQEHNFDYTNTEVKFAIQDASESNEELSSETSDSLPSILIVEDNKDMSAFIKGLLQNEYQVYVAENGKIGIDVASKYSLDLIISDVMMPEMNGLEFCKAIKSNLNTSHIPIILLTAKALDKQKIEGYEVGADDYLIKPFNPMILELKVKNILKQKSVIHNKITRDFQITPKEVVLTSPDEKMLSDLLKLMDENIDNSAFNVNAMCESVNLSHMHFIRKVKKLTGKKPVELLRSYRMKRALDLLAQDKLTISEVAYSVGFEMPSSFSRAFKKEFGKSPSEYVASQKPEVVN